METAPIDPAAQDAGTDPPADDAGQTSLAGQLTIDGFPLRGAQVRIAGRSIEINAEDLDDYRLGQEIEYRFTGRVVKNHNHLVNEDEVSSVDRAIIVHMTDVSRVVTKVKRSASE